LKIEENKKYLDELDKAKEELKECKNIKKNYE